MAESKSILDLDNRSLNCLFSYLSFEDKLKLAMVNERFDSIIKDTIGNELIDVTDLTFNFTREEAESLLIKYGNCIKRFRYSKSIDDEANNDYAKLISMHCPNLEEAYMARFEITVDNVPGQLVAAFKNLKNLKLKKCTLGNAACMLLSHLTQLEVLDLEDSKLTGKGLDKLNKLIDLRLKNCRNFKCKNFLGICTANKLKRLNIAGFKQLTNGALRVLLETQTNLETLVLGDKYWLKNFERLCRIGNFREILLIGCYEETVANYTEELAKNRKDTLEAMELHLPLIYSENYVMLTKIINGICEFVNLRAISFRNCLLFENPNLVKITKSCTQLEMLDLHGSSFSDVSIIESIESLPKLRYLDISHCAVKNSFYSRLLGTRIEQDFNQQLIVFTHLRAELAKILKSEEYAEGQDYVKLTTEHMRYCNDVSILTCLECLNAKHASRIYQTTRSHRKLKSQSQSPAQPSLLCLDDNCLYEIFKHLNVIEKLTLTLTHSHFYHITKYFLRTDVVDIVRILENFTVREAEQIFSRCGHVMRRLLVELPAFHYNIEYYNLAVKYCTNVEEIVFIAIYMSECEDRCAKLIASSAKTLKQVKTKHWNTEDNVAQEISKLPNLQTLSLKSAHITGQYLNNLTSLQSLDVGKCEDLDAEHFNAICRSNKLIELNIRGCKGLDATSFRTLVETQTKLKRLTLGGVYGATNIYIVAKLKSLIDISLRQCIPQETIELLTDLSEFRGKEIEYLEVKYSAVLTPTILPNFRDCVLQFPNLIYLRLLSSNMVDSLYIKRIVKSCPRLEILDLHSSDNLNEDGIVEAVEKLKYLRHFDVKFSDFNNPMEIYKRCHEIKKCKKDTIPLILYIQNEGEPLDHVIDTKEYKVMEKYVILSSGWIHDINKDDYAKTRHKQQHLKQPPVSIKNESNFNWILPGPSILDLPVSCLLKIISTLDTIDILKFAYVSAKIRHAMKSVVSEILFDINDISRAFTIAEVQQLFREFGENIKRVNYSVSSTSNPLEYLVLIQPYSEHLREICIHNAYTTQMDEIRKLFFSPAQKLEKLGFYNCYPLEPVMQKLIEKHEQGMNPFEHLTELYFIDSDSLQSNHFVAFCKNCVIKKLDIRSCQWLRDEDFTLLIETQNDSLEWLGISCDYSAENFTEVSRLSNLKHINIEIFSYSPVLEVLLDKLIKYRRNELMSLEVTDRSNRSFDYAIINQIVDEKCRKFVRLQKVEINHPKPYVKPYKYE